MTADKDAQKNFEDKETTALSASDNLEKPKVAGAEEDIENNPDIEDPRLFSPLLEPDRPDSQERISDDTADTENPAD